MHFDYKVSVDVDRVEGKFASRDELGESIRDQIEEALNNLELSGLGADGTSEYEVTESSADVA